MKRVKQIAKKSEVEQHPHGGVHPLRGHQQQGQGQQHPGQQAHAARGAGG